MNNDHYSHTKEKFYELRNSGYSETLAYESCIEAGMNPQEVARARFQYRLETDNTQEHRIVNHLKGEGNSSLEILRLLNVNKDFLDLDIHLVIKVLSGS